MAIAQVQFMIAVHSKTQEKISATDKEAAWKIELWQLLPFSFDISSEKIVSLCLAQSIAIVYHIDARGDLCKRQEAVRISALMAQPNLSITISALQCANGFWPDMF